MITRPGTKVVVWLPKVKDPKKWRLRAFGDLVIAVHPEVAPVMVKTKDGT